ncbi:MAG: SLBB domain-containing protein, partial [Gemmatimonadetes bacterium]|nr:SLBB domain-containing protein [Gemmatimonadota bacterium]
MNALLFPLPSSRLFSLVAALSLAPGVAAQVPSASQAQQLLQQAQRQPGLADSLRARLLQSGMSVEQVRARLRASGYPESLLDQYLGPAQQGRMTPEPLAQQLAAAEALGVGPITMAVSPLRVDTGYIRFRGDSLAPPSRVFGVDVFRRRTTQFLPLLSGPVPADYHLGPGDVLVLILTGDVETAYTLQVTREGFVLIPQVGQVFVANLTLEQLRELLYTRLGRAYSGIRRGPNATTRFDVSVANVRTVQVYVVGEVGQPGAFQVSALGTVLTALYAAGGVTERANTRRIELRRGGKTAAAFDLYDYLLRGDTRNDIRLETGDVVFVPVHGTRVAIAGAVTRPAVYELNQGESLADLVRASGGFRADAELKRVAIHRILPAAERGPGPFPRAVVDVALTPKLAGEPGDGAPGAGSREPGAGRSDPTSASVLIPIVTLEDGDSVVVDSIAPLGEGSYYVAIAGMVKKSGQFAWHQGMTLRDLVTLARGPRVGAYLQEAEVARLPADRSAGQLATTLRVPLDSTYLFERDSAGRYIGPPGLPFPPRGTPEVELQPYDNVLILRQPNFELQRNVHIMGEVSFPGTYSLKSKDDRLADLIQRAGNLSPRAYADGIQFFRKANAAGRIDIDLPRALRDPMG